MINATFERDVAIMFLQLGFFFDSLKILTRSKLFNFLRKCADNFAIKVFDSVGYFLVFYYEKVTFSNSLADSTSSYQSLQLSERLKGFSLGFFNLCNCSILDFFSKW